MMLLKFALRNIKKRPFLNLIKVTGLYLGLIGVVFIALFLKNELSYDHFYAKSERIFRLTTTDPTAFEDAHFARIFNSEEVLDWTAQVPEIASFVRLSPYRGGLLMHENQFYEIQQAFWSDSTFFKIFDTELVKGDKASVFSDPGAVVISESFAQKIFGDSDPIGGIITIPEGHFNNEKNDFIIKGVIRDFPQNSHFHPDVLLAPGSDKIGGWAYTYLLLRDNANAQSVAATLSQLMTARKNEAAETNTFAHLQNVKDIHLHSNLFREIEPNGSMTTLYAFSLAALILLFIALSNYASLNLGMAGFYTRFMALNRILGSSKRINFNYFLTESLIVVLLAIAIGALTIGIINNMVLERYHINLLKGNGTFVLGLFFVFGFLSIITGVQSLLRQRINRFPLSQSLKTKGTIKSHKKIVIAQYAFAMMLLVAVIVISKQNTFALKYAMGAAQGNIISIGPVHTDIQKDFPLFKSELLQRSTIKSVSAMMDAPGGETHDMFLFQMEGQPKDEDHLKPIGVFACDYSFAHVFDLTFLSGANFSEKNKDEEGNGEYILNETAIPYLGYQDSDDLIGKRFKLLSPVEGVDLPDGKIVGVVKDFHLSGVHLKVEPLVLFKRENSWLSNIVVSYTPQMEKEAIAYIQKVWTGMFPNYPFSYDYVDAMYQKVYKTEMIQANLLTLFTIISLFICSIGLLGISLLVSQSKVKEIGIRKVNGATIPEILIMLNRDFIKWVFIAFVVATPFTYYAMYQWLQGFAYKIDISWWMFIIAGGVTLFISLVTVSWQSFRAAMANPVDALRDE
ncbi:ABC transporter permease [Arenibacter sp. GZD96]|uniref:ABC transporter permease n=1 Tax=Aurantibrevibacter litoralis TaxID=3106030 RepID=UPI002AFDE4CC|nr:ABC transporter permease [Arenibacter sp. GZD-96]MEA1786510.1 ABC transporter permease [Arenibacter sp. GZD-96]